MKIFAYFFAAILFSTVCFSQIPTNISLQIIKAEDERRFDKSLEVMTMNQSKDVRKRVALAIGRIGDDRGILALTILLNNDSDEVQEMAAFAIGEIESIKGADAILKTLAISNITGEVRVRAIEAAGKIAAANAKDEKSKLLGEAILNALKFENSRRSMPNTKAILFGLTAILRAKPANSSSLVVEFLDYSSPAIRQNALNTLGRLRTKDKDLTATALKLLTTDEDAIVRANACRILGISEDSTTISPLLKAALNEKDSRVRVSAIRALGNFKEKEIGDKLIERGEILLKNFKMNKSELLEVATTLGRFYANADDEKAINFLKRLDIADKSTSSETTIAFAKIFPQKFVDYFEEKKTDDAGNWQMLSAYAQAQAEIAGLAGNIELKNDIAGDLRSFFAIIEEDKMKNTDFIKSIPDTILAYSKFKETDLEDILRDFLKWKDEQIRATSASLLGEQPQSDDNEKALDEALNYSLKFDTKSNDATLAILDAIGKQKNAKTSKSLQSALDSKDILVRRKAVDVLKTLGIDASDKIGTVTNSVFKQTDYLRAISRKNSTVKAVFTTEKGVFTINLMPEDAPLTVENFIKLARSNYFNGLTVHRVVPNFVMQDGDPRGDGNGGPGYSIRCEVNMLEYERGAVGMALSGKDTGGSQWFVTHSPQPHLDGGYTVFGKVNETDMKIVDTISRGDKILTVKIIESIKVKAENARKR
jgi:cyclophilin family peptidyl-prolyl cis-trans isomerase/HEAT repeat protein